MQPSSESDFDRDMAELHDLGEQVLSAFMHCDSKDLVEKGLERLEK